MKEKMTAGKQYCFISAVIILCSYVIQRILNMTLEQTERALLAEAFAFTLLTGVVCFLISKSREAFYGILIAIFGIRMLPPEITALSDYNGLAGLLYFLVGKVSFLIFLIMIIKLYEQQEKPRELKPLPIICTIIIVPFFNEIRFYLNDYITSISNGNMIYAHLCGFAVYSAAMLCLLYVAVRCNAAGAKLICDYQMIALIVNTGRRICAVVINLVNNQHIGKNYFCWILIYVLFFAAFIVLKRRKQAAQ